MWERPNVLASRDVSGVRGSLMPQEWRRGLKLSGKRARVITEPESRRQPIDANPETKWPDTGPGPEDSALVRMLVLASEREREN